MPALTHFRRGDKVKILGIEPSRNEAFPLDPLKGECGTVTEVDQRDLLIWVQIDGCNPVAFEPWELEKL